jgi:hypothetical protein
MINLPRRSVTRFFIPLIDVLTLLFCIFLVLPLAQNPGAGPSEAARTSEERLRQLQEELDRRGRAGDQVARELQEQILRLKREKTRALQEQVAVRVLEIDPDTGALFYRDPDRVPVRNQADARALIDEDRRARGGRDLYYLILYPRGRTKGFPTRGQREQYDRWFADVAHAYDIPGPGPGGRKEP